MLKSLSTFILLIILLISGCTIEKRLYRKGWYIASRKEWKSDGGKEQSAYKCEQSKSIRQEAAYRFIIDTNDLERVSAVDSVTDQLPEFRRKLPETNRETVAEKAVEKEKKPAHFTVVKVQNPDHERSIESRKVRAMVAILIGFSFLMLAIIFAINPVSLTFISLYWFVGIVFILLIGLMAINFSAHSRQKWVEIKGEMLDAYKARLRNKAFKLSVSTLVVGAILLILMLPALDILLIFSSITVMFLFFTVTAWLDYRKISAANTLSVTEDTLKKNGLGEEPFFRRLTPEELSNRKHRRINKAIFLQVYLVISLTIILFLFLTASVLTYAIITALALLFCLFTFLIWFDLVSKNKHPERERIRMPETYYRELTPEESAERKRNRFLKAIFLQLFFSVFFGIILITIGGGLIAISLLLMLLFVFALLTFIIWFELIQKNNHPEWDKIRLEDSVIEENEPEKESNTVDPENIIKQAKRTFIFLTFVALVFLIVSLLMPSGLVWIIFGALALGAIVTFFQFLFQKKRLSTKKS